MRAAFSTARRRAGALAAALVGALAATAAAPLGCGPDFRADIPCDADDNCPEELFCVEGFCGEQPVRSCLNNLDCPQNQHCEPVLRECVNGPQPRF